MLNEAEKTGKENIAMGLRQMISLKMTMCFFFFCLFSQLFCFVFIRHVNCDKYIYPIIQTRIHQVAVALNDAE